MTAVAHLSEKLAQANRLLRLHGAQRSAAILGGGAASVAGDEDHTRGEEVKGVGAVVVCAFWGRSRVRSRVGSGSGSRSGFVNRWRWSGSWNWSSQEGRALCVVDGDFAETGDGCSARYVSTRGGGVGECLLQLAQTHRLLGLRRCKGGAAWLRR